MEGYERQLRRLVNQAWDLRGTPYLTDACSAIVDLHHHKLELEAQRGWEALQALDPFVRECLVDAVRPNR